MARRHMPESHSAHPNVTPLIDIIMCLIIFFMLVTKIGVTTGAEDIKIPATMIGTKIEDMGNTLTLNIPDKSYNSDNLPVVRAFVKLPGDNDQHMVPLRLKTPGTNVNELEAALKYYKKQNADIKVIIRADSKQDWRCIEPVLLTCNAAGIRTINYNTEKGVNP